MDKTEQSIVIDGETITADMVERVEYDRPPVRTLGPNDFMSHGHVISGDGFLHYAPGPVTYITLHLKDGRVLKTECYT